MEKWKKRKLCLTRGIERWRDEKLICLIKKKNEKIENIVVINSNAPFSYGFVFFFYTHCKGWFWLEPQNRNGLRHNKPEQ